MKVRNTLCGICYILIFNILALLTLVKSTKVRLYNNLKHKQIDDKGYHELINVRNFLETSTEENIINFINSVSLVNNQKISKKRDIDNTTSWDQKYYRIFQEAILCAYFKIDFLAKKFKQNLDELYFINYISSSNVSEAHTFLFGYVINKSFLLLPSDNNIIDPVPLIKVCVPADRKYKTFISPYCVFSNCKNTLEEDEVCSTNK